MATAICITTNSNGNGTISELKIMVIKLANNAVRESINVLIRMVTMAYGIIYTLKRSSWLVIAVRATKEVISRTINMTCCLFLYSCGLKKSRYA